MLPSVSPIRILSKGGLAYVLRRHHGKIALMTRWVRRLRTFCSMDASTRGLVLDGVFFSLIVITTFRLASPRRIQGWLRFLASGKAERDDRDSMRTVRRVIAVRRAIRKATGLNGTCLANSLILWALLRKQGLNSTIRIGVRKRNGAFEAHAWLEYKSAPVGEEAADADAYEPYPGKIEFDN